MVGEVLDGIALRSIVLKAHKPEMIALWAKENKIKGWEHYWRAYHPSEVQKRRQWSIKAYDNNKVEKESGNNFKRYSNEKTRQTYKKG